MTWKFDKEDLENRLKLLEKSETYCRCIGKSLWFHSQRPHRGEFATHLLHWLQVERLFKTSEHSKNVVGLFRNREGVWSRVQWVQYYLPMKKNGPKGPAWIKLRQPGPDFDQPSPHDIVLVHGQMYLTVSFFLYIWFKTKTKRKFYKISN